MLWYAYACQLANICLFFMQFISNNIGYCFVGLTQQKAGEDAQQDENLDAQTDFSVKKGMYDS